MAEHKLRIHIASINVVSKDAIGTDVMKMASALSSAGYPTDVYALGSDDASGHVVKPLLNANPAAWGRRTDLTIYHHSTGCPPGEGFVGRNRGNIVIRYHNVTPASFFEGYSEEHVKASLEGERETRRFASSPAAMFWGDSQFNCSELTGYGAPEAKCRVLPPFHCVEELADEPIDRALLAAYKDGCTNILFVGGFKPNKGHERAIRIFALFRHHMNTHSRLILAGSVSAHFASYLHKLRQLAADLGITERVVFMQSVSAAQLRTLYFLSDLFLCVSEHEGFCVPLVEAMYFRVPIVAWGITAVAETIGGCGLSWNDFDEVQLAESIHFCTEHPECARALRNAGHRRYLARYAPDALVRQLLSLVEEVEYGSSVGQDARISATPTRAD